MQTLTIWVQPRGARARATVTVGVRVNDARARLDLVALYGQGISQQRVVASSRSGTTLIRLPVLAPATCRGAIVARIYVTATTPGRALTRATTFTVGCPQRT